MKIEVLKDIKNAEEDYKKMISEAQERRKSAIANAELEADNQVQKAHTDAEEYKKQRIADARSQATMRYEKIVSDGKSQAVALESRGRQNLAKAVDLLVSRFREQLNVSA
ncbi:MAG TPA: ATP synthase archaeal subunit H [Methanospirillum sp.]|nr:ATP synthase archaeal subunit H [Methanospirillum sp.]